MITETTKIRIIPVWDNMKSLYEVSLFGSPGLIFLGIAEHADNLLATECVADTKDDISTIRVECVSNCVVRIMFL